MTAVISGSKNSRWFLIDILRGLAVIAMIGFHFTWDLGYFQFIDYDIAFTTEGRVMSHLIAGTFLFLVGVSLALAHRDHFEPRAFLIRFFKIAGAAALVSLGTYYAMPEDWIFFGVLHCIALSSLLALPLLRAPLGVIFISALLSVAAPALITHDFFDQPILFWLGLNKVLPRTNDYVPLFPWFGVVLFGIFAARFSFERARLVTLVTQVPANPLARVGRQALPIYLLHQPLLMGVLWVYISVFGPPAQALKIEPAFFQNCTQSCAASGRGIEACDRACACLGHALSGMKNPTRDEALQSALAICRKDGAL